MLKNRHFISYFSTTFLYAAIIGLFLYIPYQTKISTERSEEKVMQVMLSDFVPEVLPQEEKPVVEEVKEVEVEEEKIIEPEIIEEPVPPKIEKIVEEPTPEPVAEKPKKKSEVKKTPKKKLKKKPKKTVKKKKPVQKARRASIKKSQANPDEINKFYKKIRVKINQNKSYPKIAKRRRMQGSVKVTFTVLRSGKVSNIILKGPKVFQNSARHAVKSAFPISVKNIPVTLPATVHVTLHYQIR